MKAAFHTLGCKLNFSETSTLGQKFLENGFDIIPFNQSADVYVINTCTVTENADRECRQIVRRALRNNPDAYVIVAGCYAQLRSEEISKIEGVDLVLGSNEKFKIFEYAGDFKKNNLSCVYVSPAETLSEFNSAYSTDADSRTRAFFKIQDGCDYKCTFCTIPLARGKSRSQKPEHLVSDFKKLLEKGYKEIILTGVNVGDYGKNVDYSLYKLLRDFISIEGDFRIRISSIEPNLLTEDIIKLTAENEKLAKHFHIPLQSGSDNVLRLMKRRYDSLLYEKLIYKVKEIIPEAGIGVDVIVGTPGETENDFETTYEFIKKLPVSYLHVFTYSERPNTEAILMKGKVEQAEKKRRNNMLRILGEKKKAAFYGEQVGKELEVLFEHTVKGGNMEGFSSNYARVKGASNFDLVNRLTNVKIVNANGEYCYSE